MWRFLGDDGNEEKKEVLIKIGAPREEPRRYCEFWPQFVFTGQYRVAKVFTRFFFKKALLSFYYTPKRSNSLNMILVCTANREAWMAGSSPGMTR
jgi:hypothetical protein